MAARGTGLSRRFKARSRVKTARRRPGRCRPYGGDRGFARLDSTPPRGRSSAGRASASQAERNQRARFRNNAAVAQQVERELPKLEVAGSRPVRRFLQMLVRLSAGRRGVSSQLGLGQAAAFSSGAGTRSAAPLAAGCRDKAGAASLFQREALQLGAIAQVGQGFAKRVGGGRRWGGAGR